MKKLIVSLALFLLATAAGATRVFEKATVGTLPSCTTSTEGAAFYVTDGASATDCVTGSGSTDVVCACDGSSWSAVGGSGGSGDITDVWACTTGNCNSITGASGDSLDAGSADSISPATRSTSVPATCTEGYVHQETDAGGVETYTCTASNTFKQHAPYDYDPDEPARGTGVDYAEEYVGDAEALSWTTGNWSTTTSTFTLGTAYFVAPLASAENVRFRGLAAPCSDCDYVVVAALASTHEGLSYNTAGVSVLNGTTGTPTRIDICGFQMNSTDISRPFWGYWSNYTTFGANVSVLTGENIINRASPMYAAFYVEYGGGTPTGRCYWSYDGVYFWANAAAASISSMPEYVGLALNASNLTEAPKLGVFWWRTISGARITSPGPPILMVGGPL